MFVSVYTTAIMWRSEDSCRDLVLVWILGIKCRSSALVASPFTH